ncbi:biotin--[acetyl-CoA-carboxylase] ligase [Caulobacter mirabilis]|uniref:biotin--[biotin carboxyl-carrier protein] ligase n=1 Tax=Caulobacter mirabilis TaxID=69666 RepID=A0A2D2AYQ6_9CAUL|nr:biotin--[acetyl-CoA-carboxylase] ligase [Caulobacter mirabilis]ATQ43057.1 biotin--[acetyl-CoA-carboxylase] ligase [Caulobacter mirabilis]
MTIPPIEALEEVDSTNAEARRRAEAGETGPVWITAKRQTAGHGRRGRAWETGQGNLAATLLFVTDKPPAEAAQVSFLAALAVADLADVFVPPELVRLKWPNDPMVGGLKVCGILVESGPHPSGGLWIAMGVGVNLATPPVSPERPATAFTEHMTTPPPAPLDALALLARNFERWRVLWQSHGFPPIAEAWTRRAQGLGQPCVARLGNETVEGIAEGLDGDGALRLRLPDGMLRRITAGDVFFGGS